jgi:hypothetical protein
MKASVVVVRQCLSTPNAVSFSEWRKFDCGPHRAGGTLAMCNFLVPGNFGLLIFIIETKCSAAVFDRWFSVVIFREAQLQQVKLPKRCYLYS